MNTLTVLSVTVNLAPQVSEAQVICTECCYAKNVSLYNFFIIKLSQSGFVKMNRLPTKMFYEQS